MNVYFLVEGRQCERRLYPSWLAVLTPHLTKIDQPDQTTGSSYYLISGEGYPSIIGRHLQNAIRDVEDSGHFDWLIVVVDADEEDASAREQAVRTAAAQATPRLGRARLGVIVQFRCIETWLLGNRRIFVRQPQHPSLSAYVAHYDCSRRDPEAMLAFPGFATQAQFHHAYLKAIFAERHETYSKSRPGHAASPSYLNEIRRRVGDCPDALRSFQRFLRLTDSFGQPGPSPS